MHLTHVTSRLFNNQMVLLVFGIKIRLHMHIVTEVIEKESKLEKEYANQMYQFASYHIIAAFKQRIEWHTDS